MKNFIEVHIEGRNFRDVELVNVSHIVDVRGAKDVEWPKVTINLSNGAQLHPVESYDQIKQLISSATVDKEVS